MAVTIKDIAQAAGVSRGTVDRVLNGRGKVRPQVAEKVRRLASEMNYLPNRAGRELAAIKRSLRIGFLLPGVDNGFFEDILRGAQAAERNLSDFGVSLLIRQVKGYDPETHAEALRELGAEGLSGLCVTTVDVPETRRAVEELREKGIPLIATNTDLPETGRLSYVGCDYLQTGRTAGGLFSLLGIQEPRVLIVTGSKEIEGHNLRIQGFREVLREKGVSFHETGFLVCQDDDRLAYRLTKEHLLSLPAEETPNCIFVAGAGVGGVCQAAEEWGLSTRNPLVLPFDDIPITREYMRKGRIPATICQEPFEQGYRSVKLLFDYLVGGLRPPEHYITRTVIKLLENLEEHHHFPEGAEERGEGTHADP